MSETMPRLNPRTIAVKMATIQISRVLLVTTEEYGLTSWEIVQILTQMIANEIRYGIRDERHPDDPDQPGDLVAD